VLRRNLSSGGFPLFTSLFADKTGSADQLP